MLAKTEYVTTIDDTINTFLEDHFSDSKNKKVSTEEVVKGVLPGLRLALRKPDLLEALIGERSEKLLKLRTRWATNDSGQQDLFGFQQMFVLYEDGARGPMGRADLDVVTEYRERELKNMRKVHGAFERREQIFDVIIPIMKERGETCTVEAAIKIAQDAGDL